MSTIPCPKCKSAKDVHVTTPDYGHGSGVEFACYACDRFVFVDRSEAAQAESRASLELSRRNAERLRLIGERVAARKRGGGR